MKTIQNNFVFIQAFYLRCEKKRQILRNWQNQNENIGFSEIKHEQFEIRSALYICVWHWCLVHTVFWILFRNIFPMDHIYTFRVLVSFIQSNDNPHTNRLLFHNLMKSFLKRKSTIFAWLTFIFNLLLPHFFWLLIMVFYFIFIYLFLFFVLFTGHYSKTVCSAFLYITSFAFIIFSEREWIMCAQMHKIL